jgi:hypothetical protein
MSESGDPSSEGTAVRVEDIERALVLAREVAAATAKGGSATLRIEHLRALFANGTGPLAAERMQAALEAAGLTAEPPLAEATETVALSLDRRRAALAPKNGAAAGKRAAPAAGASVAGASDTPAQRPSGVAAYQAASGRKPPAAAASDAAVSLGDAERVVAAEHAEQNTAQSIAAMMPALIVPVLAASFLGPLFGAAFAGLALLASALLSRPGALADGKLGPIRMPASLARSFLLVSFGVALGALLTSLALVAAGGGDTEPADPNAPLEQTAPSTTPAQPRTTPPAPPAAEQQRREREAEAAERRRAERRAERRREARARARARARRERAREREAAPPSGATPDAGTGSAPAP